MRVTGNYIKSHKEKTLGTKEVAKLFDITPQTIVNFCNKGIFKPTRMTPRSPRKIPCEQILKYIVENDIPTSQLHPEIFKKL